VLDSYVPQPSLQPSMLLVILGAGASYDSLPEKVLNRITDEDQNNWRPPLARELFDDRASFGLILDGYPECAGLVWDLRRKLERGAVLETELEVLQEQATNYPRLYRELAAVRLYLQEVLWKCGTRWRELSHGVTNYADLLRRLDRWRHDNDRAVCIVSFNYDLLFDDAATATLGLDLHSVDAYVADDKYKYVKLHGSVNWSRRAFTDSPQFPYLILNDDRARRATIDHAAELKMSGEYLLRSPEAVLSIVSSPPSILFPAIAIPTQTKPEFECPPAHVRVLDSCLPQVQKILVIGWRGAEQTFLAKLKTLPGMATPVLVVGDSEEGTRETAANLSSMGLTESRMDRFTDGFTNFLRTDDLRAFIE
jgi:hypothetical protein